MRERILVIDDEPNIVWLFKEIFGDAYEVLGAQTAGTGCGQPGITMSTW